MFIGSNTYRIGCNDCSHREYCTADVFWKLCYVLQFVDLLLEVVDGVHVDRCVAALVVGQVRAVVVVVHSDEVTVFNLYPFVWWKGLRPQFQTIRNVFEDTFSHKFVAESRMEMKCSIEWNMPAVFVLGSHSTHFYHWLYQWVFWISCITFLLFKK